MPKGATIEMLGRDGGGEGGGVYPRFDRAKNKWTPTKRTRVRRWPFPFAVDTQADYVGSAATPASHAVHFAVPFEPTALQSGERSEQRV